MFGLKKKERPKTKVQRDEQRDEEQLKLSKYNASLQTLTAALSAISVAVAIASLNKKRDDSSEPEYYMSESMGLIRWR